MAKRFEGIILPSNLDVKKEGMTITLMLTRAAVGYERKGDRNINMQEDEAAFEGWALVLKAKGVCEEICLDADITDEIFANDSSKGHYHRFLYRALRFSENFGDWFNLSSRVEKAVKEFEKYYYSGKRLCNNVPSGKAGDNDKLENQMEARFAEGAVLETAIPGLSKVYRQLPVGLFLGDTATDNNRIFTGGKSAIDLWGMTSNELHIFELKAINAKVGVLTELFFYAAYSYDMFCEGGPDYIKPCPGEKGSSERGYANLYAAYEEGRIKSIVAHILTDQLHPEVRNKEIFKLMAAGKNKCLKFEMPLIYEYKFEVNLLS